MTLLDMPVSVVHPATGGTACIFFLVGLACALLLSAGWFAGIRHSDHHRGKIDHRPTASAPRPISR